MIGAAVRFKGLASHSVRPANRAASRLSRDPPLFSIHRSPSGNADGFVANDRGGAFRVVHQPAIRP